jgi:hypothetical protein
MLSRYPSPSLNDPDPVLSKYASGLANVSRKGFSQSRVIVLAVEAENLRVESAGCCFLPLSVDLLLNKVATVAVSITEPRSEILTP